MLGSLYKMQFYRDTPKVNSFVISIIAIKSKKKTQNECTVVKARATL